MHIAFHVSPRKLYEQVLGAAFAEGAKRLGDHTTFPLDYDGNADLACVLGVKDANLMNRYRQAGIPYLYWDKAYDRRQKGWFRVAINSNHPTRYLMQMDCPDDRRERFGWSPAKWRKTGNKIIVVGSSGKYHKLIGLQDATEYAEQTISAIRKYTDMEIIYRPKHTHESARPIPGTTWSIGGVFSDILNDVWAIVVQGSNAGFEGLLRGIPSIVTGEAIVKPISSTRISDIMAPRLAGRDEIVKFMNALAYHQWTPNELTDGRAWTWLKSKL